MTIKEIELLSGLSRANIRFYEKEGFLSPERHENGYREYTEEDLEVLKKIRLLRTLHVPLSEVRDVLSSTQAFLQVIENHIKFLDQEIQNYQDSKNMCHKMMRDIHMRQELNTDVYLKDLDDRDYGGSEMNEDTIRLQRVDEEQKRFFGRAFDIGLIIIPIEVMSILHPYSESDLVTVIINTCLQLIVFMLLEPLFLTFFSTTPGKWLTGVRVIHKDGRKLTYFEAVKRTWAVLVYGLGLSIPVIECVCLYQGLNAVYSGNPTKWDQYAGSEILIDRTKPWKICLYVVACFIPFFIRVINEYLV